jgi:hypothetical protein
LHCSKKIISHLSEISPARRGWNLVSFVGVIDLMTPKHRRAFARCIRCEPDTPARAQIERCEGTAPRAFDIAPARIAHAWVIICNMQWYKIGSRQDGA